MLDEQLNSAPAGFLRRTARAVALVGTAALLLTACDSLWPSLDAEDPAAASAEQPAPAEPTVNADPTQPVAADPALATAPQPVTTTGGGFSGSGRTTFVGDKVSQLEGDLAKLRGNVGNMSAQAASIRSESAAAASRYHAAQAEIVARLQQGTTPGNPEMVDRWNAAQADLESIAESIPAMTQLSNDVADEGAFGQYLMNSVQATYGLSGAVEADHIRLRRLEDQVHQTVVEVDRMLTDLSQDINRQNSYLANERQNLTTLSLAIKNGELYGTNLATRAFTQTENLARAAARSTQPGPSDSPLVIIRFDQPNVQYQQALYNAVSQALERKPNASFDVLAVSPSQGAASQIALNSAAARRSAQDVLRTLTDMGVSTSSVQLLASTQEVSSNEVHVFVR